MLSLLCVDYDRLNLDTASHISVYCYLLSPVTPGTEVVTNEVLLIVLVFFSVNHFLVHV